MKRIRIAKAWLSLIKRRCCSLITNYQTAVVAQHLSNVTNPNVSIEESQLTYRQEIMLVVVKRLMLGMVLVFAVFLCDRYVASYRLRNVQVTQLMNNRLNALSSAWTKLYEVEALNNELGLIFMEGEALKFHTRAEFFQFVFPKAQPIIEQMRAKSTELFSILDQNRFWLGEDIYLKINNRCTAYLLLFRAFVQQNQSEMDRMMKRLQETKPDIEEFMRTL